MSIDNDNLISTLTDEEIEVILYQYRYWSKQKYLGQSIVTEMLNDPIVRMGSQLLFLPILQAKWTIEHDDESVAQYITDAINGAWESIVTCLGYQMILDGFAGGEVVYSQDSDGYKVQTVLYGNYNNTQLFEDENGELYPSINGIEIPVWKSVVIRNNPTPDYMYGQSILRAAYDPWRRKQMAELSRIRQIERISGAQVFIEFPDRTGIGGTSTGEADFRKVVESFSRSRVIGARATGADEPGWKITPIPQSDNSSSFKNAIENYNSDILRAFCIPDRLATNNDSTGSRADQIGKQDIYYLTITAFLRKIESVVNARIIKPLTLFQYGEAVNPPRLSFSSLIDSEKEMWYQLLQAGYNSGKVQIDQEIIKGRNGIK